MLVHLFERIHLFLQRLNRYTGMSLTDDLTGLFGKIMAQLLTILALATKAMTDRRISEPDLSLCPISVAHYVAEMFLKRLIGKTGVEDAVLQLDMLTKEESLMIVGRSLEISHEVKCLSLPEGATIDGKANPYSQGTNCKRNSDYGSPLRILPLIIILRAKCSIAALQHGLSRGTNSVNGRRTVPFCGSVAIVSFSYPYHLYDC